LQYGVMRRIITYYESRTMSAVKTISFRIPTDTVESLDELAKSMDRDRSHVLNEAVENYLRLNEHHIKLIQKGLRAAERGDFVPDADMKKLILRMRRAK
jgi:RHH-type rel operon transcriptional repressor/antitoxin RelB